jgi:methyl-accepting chemotaxis protein
MPNLGKRRKSRRIDAAEPNGATATFHDNEPHGTLSAEQQGAEPILSLRQLLDALKAARSGDFSVRLPRFRDELLNEIAQVFNEVVGLNETRAREIVRVSKMVGEEGRLTERAAVGSVPGPWATEMESINRLIDSLVQPTAEVGRVITAVAQGDLSKKMLLELEGRPLKGEFSRIGGIVNTMVDQLSAFSSEVTRVAREVGTEGKLGGQGKVPGVAGTWKDLTDSVNAMAGGLTAQVRNIAKVTTAVANGDLSQKITVEAEGEILELKNTINSMVDNLSTIKAFTDITQAIDSTSRTGKDISVAAGDQKRSIDAVSQSLDKISGIAADTSTASTQSAAGAKRLLTKTQELATTATTLPSMSEKFLQTVGRFTIGDDNEGKPLEVDPKNWTVE